MSDDQLVETVVRLWHDRGPLDDDQRVAARVVSAVRASVRDELRAGALAAGQRTEQRRTERAQRAVPAVLVALRANPEGMSFRTLEAWLRDHGWSTLTAREAIRTAVRCGLVERSDGDRRSNVHRLASGSP